MATQAEAFATAVNTEQRFQELERRFVELRQELTLVKGERDVLKNDFSALEDEVKRERKKADDALAREDAKKRELQSAEAKHLEMQQQRKAAEARFDLKQREVDHMSDELKSFSQKLGTAHGSESAAQRELTELRASQIPLQCQVDRLEKEKAVLHQHKDWLDGELKAKTTDILQLRKAHSTERLELTSQLETKAEAAKRAEEALAASRAEVEQLEAKQRQLTNANKDEAQRALAASEEHGKALAAQQRLSQLYNDGKRQAEARQKQLAAELGALRARAESAHAAAKEQNEKNMQDATRRLAVQQAASDEHTKALEAELANARREGSLRSAAGAAGTAGAGGAPAESAVSVAQRLLDEGVSLTDMYNRVVDAEAALRKERSEKEKAEMYLQQILREVESKAPIIAGQRLDYERALASHDELSRRLDETNRKRNAAEDEVRQLRAELDETSAGKLELEQHNVDLARQMQALLREQLALKQAAQTGGGAQSIGGGTPSRALPGFAAPSPRPGSASRSPFVASRSPYARSPFTSSSPSSGASNNAANATPAKADGRFAEDVISENLVEYRSVDELQKKNQQLLVVVRRLSTQREKEHMDEADGSKAHMKRQLEETLQQLEDVRSARQRQEEMVTAIVHQRDMYRVLLAQANEGFSKPAQGGDAATTPGAAGGSSSSAAATAPAGMLDCNSGMSSGADQAALSALTEELAGAKTKARETREELEAIKEDRSRLADEKNTLRADLFAAKSNLARANADTDHHKERFERDQATYNTATAEIDRLRKDSTAAQARMQEQEKHVAELHDKLYAASSKQGLLSAEVTKAQGELKITSDSEQRTQAENATLKAESQRQAALIDSVQRIEQAMESRSSAEINRLQDEKEALGKELSQKRKALEKAQEDVNHVQRGKAMELQLANTKLERSREEATSAHQDATQSALRLKDALAHVAQLESDMAARLAQVRELKQQVGGDDAATDAATDEAALEYSRLQQQLKDSEAALAEAREHLKQYSAISAANEKALAELSAASEKWKSDKQAELDAKSKELEAVRADEKRASELATAAAAEVERLREALRVAREEGAAADLRASQTAEANSADLAAAEQRAGSLKKDMDVHRRAAQKAQSDYERELQMHAADVKGLTELRALAESRTRQADEADVKLAGLAATAAANEANWRLERDDLKAAESTAKEAKEALQNQNALLHSQLETLGKQVQRLQSDRVEQVDAMGGGDESNKMLAELREVLRYVKREKETVDCKLEVAEQERSRATQQLSQTRVQLEAARAELKDATEGRAGVAPDSEHQQLLAQVQQLNTYRESNAKLRHDKLEAEAKVKDIETRLGEAKGALEPSLRKERELVAEKGALKAEVASLLQENSEQCKRMDALFQKHPQIDPAKHKTLVAEHEALHAKTNDLGKSLEQAQTLNDANTTKLATHEKRIQELDSQAQTIPRKDKQIEDFRKMLRENMQKHKKEIEAAKAAATQAPQQSPQELQAVNEQIASLEQEKSTVEAKLKTQEKGVKEARDAARNGMAKLNRAKQYIETLKAKMLENELEVPKPAGKAKAEATAAAPATSAAAVGATAAAPAVAALAPVVPVAAAAAAAAAPTSTAAAAAPVAAVAAAPAAALVAPTPTPAVMAAAISAAPAPSAVAPALLVATPAGAGTGQKKRPLEGAAQDQPSAVAAGGFANASATAKKTKVNPTTTPAQEKIDKEAEMRTKLLQAKNKQAATAAIPAPAPAPAIEPVPSALSAQATPAAAPQSAAATSLSLPAASPFGLSLKAPSAGAATPAFSFGGSLSATAPTFSFNNTTPVISFGSTTTPAGDQEQALANSAPAGAAAAPFGGFGLVSAVKAAPAAADVAAAVAEDGGSAAPQDAGMADADEDAPTSS